MYAGIRQAKAKTGMVEELTRRIKEGAIPLISDVPGFNAYYVIYTPDDTVMAISIFNDYAAAQESNKRALAWIETELAPLLAGPATAVAGPVIVHTLARLSLPPHQIVKCELLETRIIDWKCSSLKPGEAKWPNATPAATTTIKRFR